ncbi:hypothetical protein CVU37_09890 [candidate division BRC1 bacterium HGW-BRC1-1]|jgi:lipoprotein-anchoring transpeptidase ErfK/SrfK|nr:MAG: hypothetical protein CVU37_09890 [candidate division BRC1 bacterium HGW-BRC1-1]
MKRTIVILVMLAVVATALAGGFAFILQQNKLGKLKRIAAQAEEKVETKDYEPAVVLLKQVEEAGGTARSTFLLGKIYFDMGKPSEAMPYFKRIESKYGRSTFVPDSMLYQARYALEVEGKAKPARETFLRVLEQYPDSEAADHSLLYLAGMSYDEGDVKMARRNLEQIVRRPDSPARQEAEFILGDINMKQLRSPDPGPNDELYTIKKGDALWNISRKYNVPVDMLEGINNIKASTLSIGQQIKIPRLNLSVVVDKAHRTLTLRNNNQFLKKYRVSINRTDTKVPAGDYAIRTKSGKGIDYTDTDTGVITKAGDPANPMGSRALELRRGVMIHGGATPETMGQYAANGTIGMANQDIEEMYPLVNTGTQVTIKGKNLMEDKK